VGYHIADAEHIFVHPFAAIHLLYTFFLSKSKHLLDISEKYWFIALHFAAVSVNLYRNMTLRAVTVRYVPADWMKVFDIY